MQIFFIANMYDDASSYHRYYLMQAENIINEKKKYFSEIVTFKNEPSCT